jgi:hypothetical protein
MHPRILAVMAVAVAGSACAGFGSDRINYINVDTSYSPNEFVYASSPGEIRTVVLGNPYDVADDRFRDIVTRSMYGHHFGRATNFTTAPSEKAMHNYKVVILFDAPPTVGGPAACVKEPGHEFETAPAKAETTKINVIAAFCSSNEPLTYLAAVADRGPGPDQSFEAFIGEITLELFPPINRENLPDHDILLP